MPIIDYALPEAHMGLRMVFRIGQAIRRQRAEPESARFVSVLTPEPEPVVDTPATDQAEPDAPVIPTIKSPLDKDAQDRIATLGDMLMVINKAKRERPWLVDELALRGLRRGREVDLAIGFQLFGDAFLKLVVPPAPPGFRASAPASEDRTGTTTTRRGRRSDQRTPGASRLPRRRRTARAARA